MRYFIVFSYLLAAAINLAPAVGVLSNSWLVQLYGIEIHSPDVSLLLRHRALLFALVGGLLLAASMLDQLRTQAGIVGLISMLSYILLFVLTGPENESLFRVALIDGFVVLVFLAGFLLHLAKPPAGK